MPKVSHSPHPAPPVTADSAVHKSVLLDEVLQYLDPKPGGRYLDGTLGLAGHASALLEKSGGQAFLCGLDRDPQALERAEQKLAAQASNSFLFNLEYADFEQALDKLGWDKIDGALLDLGVSSLQLDVAERGFSLHADGPLDMRMDMGALPRQDSNNWAASARTLVNRADFNNLRDIIAQYGEDPQAGRIARAIVDARQTGEISSTAQLAELIYQAYPPKWRATARNHPATRTFQAIRMVVNDELGQLKKFLDAILPRLADGGRLAIISFHSLEDRQVKQQFRAWARGCICPPRLPRCVCNHQPEIRELTRKPLVPSREECLSNPRAASAKLRVAEKLPEQAEARP